MVVQYLIDWDGVLSQVDDLNRDRMAERLVRLSTQIRRNGCLIVSDYVTKRLIDFKSKYACSSIGPVLDNFFYLSNDVGINVEGQVGKVANSFEGTVALWREYLRKAGDCFARGDERCLLVGNEDRADKCFRSVTVQKAVACEKAYCWTHLQRFRKGTTELLRFRQYLESFVATSTGEVRVYDPYLSSIFSPVVNARNVKAWRNSVAYLLDVLARCQIVSRVIFVTTIQNGQLNWIRDDVGRNRLRLSEVIEDLLRPIMGCRQTSFEVIFIFANEDGNRRSFHDRFMCNGRYCFSVGHGFDVCDEGMEYFELCKRTVCDKDISVLQWRNRPREYVGVEFNVFYGRANKTGNRDDIDFFVFRSPAAGSWESIVPDGWHVRSCEEIKDYFDFRAELVSCSIRKEFGGRDLTIRINPSVRV